MTLALGQPFAGALEPAALPGRFAIRSVDSHSYVQERVFSLQGKTVAQLGFTAEELKDDGMDSKSIPGFLATSALDYLVSKMPDRIPAEVKAMMDVARGATTSAPNASAKTASSHP